MSICMYVDLYSMVTPRRPMVLKGGSSRSTAFVELGVLYSCVSSYGAECVVRSLLCFIGSCRVWWSRSTEHWVEWFIDEICTSRICYFDGLERR